MKFVVLFFLLTAGFALKAQKKAKFHSQNYIGILEGEGGTNFQLQSINGFRFGTWFLGAGTGLDYQYFRSVPLFLSFNKSLCNCGRSLFFSLDGGVSWVWDSNTQNAVNGYRDGDQSPGAYFGAGLGYRILMRNNKDAFLLNVGYSGKHVKEKVASSFWCIMPPCPQTYEYFHYRLNRLSLKLGWEF